MNQQELKQLTEKVNDIVRQTAKFVQQEYGKVKNKQIKEKEHNMLVSYVDEEAERQLIEQLYPLVPNPSFLAEESESSSLKTDHRWIIDPLDGTTNFLHQIPCFAISVALEYKDEIVLGTVHEITKKETFYAWKNGGAFLNEETIKTNNTQNLQDALIATGFPYYDYDRIENYLQALRTFMQATRGIRRLGSAATDLAYVAAGRFDAFFEYSLSPWDVAAGSIIAAEAGAVVCDFKGGKDFLFGKEIVATSPGIHDVFMQHIKKAFWKK